MIYIEHWLKIECPNCDSFNWICSGDHEDLSQSDPTSIKCFKCKSIIPLVDDEWADQTYTVKGKRKPK